MRTLFCLLVLATAASGCRQANLLPFYNTPDFTPEWVNPSLSYANIHTISDFNFVDQHGKQVSEKTFAGKIYIADFFFTACPGICKRLTSNLCEVQKVFSKDNDILLISHSVTPEADNVSRLSAYATDFGVQYDKWYLVTGDRKSIYRIARESYFADEDMGVKKDENDFLHTENVLLIDRHRRIRGVYKGTSALQIQDLIHDVKILEQEE